MPTIPRFFEPDFISDSPHQYTYLLSPKTAHHVQTVLRLKTGDQCILFNNTPLDYLVELLPSSQKKSCFVKLIDSVPNLKKSKLYTHLIQGISKPEHMDYTIQKSVELGISEMTPVLTDFIAFRLKPDYFEKKTTHWHNIMISACQQSGQSQIPILNPPISLNTWMNQTTNQTAPHSTELRLLLDPDATQSIQSYLNSVDHTIQKITFLIGPEGGFSPTESDLAQTQAHFKSVQFGPRILRTETVAPVLLGILQARWGDF